MFNTNSVSEYLTNEYLAHTDLKELPLELKDYINNLSKEYFIFEEPLLLLLKDELKIKLPIKDNSVFINDRIELYLNQRVSSFCRINNNDIHEYDKTPEFIIRTVLSEGYKKINFDFKTYFLDEKSKKYYSSEPEISCNNDKKESLDYIDYNYIYPFNDHKQYILKFLEKYFSNFMEENFVKIDASIKKLFHLGEIFNEILKNDIALEDYLKTDKSYSYDFLIKKIEDIGDFLLLNDVNIINYIEDLKSIKINKDVLLKL